METAAGSRPGGRALRRHSSGPRRLLEGLPDGLHGPLARAAVFGRISDRAEVVLFYGRAMLRDEDLVWADTDGPAESVVL